MKRFTMATSANTFNKIEAINASCVKQTNQGKQRLREKAKK